MQWTYEGNEIDQIPDDYEGFVYLITNTTTGQKYIGKQFKCHTYNSTEQNNQHDV